MSIIYDDGFTLDTSKVEKLPRKDRLEIKQLWLDLNDLKDKNDLKSKFKLNLLKHKIYHYTQIYDIGHYNSLIDIEEE